MYRIFNNIIFCQKICVITDTQNHSARNEKYTMKHTVTKHTENKYLQCHQHDYYEHILKRG